MSAIDSVGRCGIRHQSADADGTFYRVDIHRLECHMDKKGGVRTSYIPTNKGSVAILQETEGNTVVLGFRRPLRQSDFKDGELIQDFVVREGKKRLVAVALDEKSAIAASNLLKDWHERRARTRFYVTLFNRMLTYMQEPSRLSRWV